MSDETIESNEYGKDLSFGNLFSWAVTVITKPRAFFGALTKDGGYGAPLLYALFWIYVGSIVQFGVARIRPLFMETPEIPLPVEILVTLVGPLILLGFGFIGAGFLFVVWHLMGSEQGYKGAFRCWAMMSPVSVISAVLGVYPPLNFLAFLFGTYLLVNASISYHGLSVKKSWIVWSLIAVLVMGLVALSAWLQRSIQESQGRFGGPAGFSDAFSGTGEDGFSLSDLTEPESEPEAGGGGDKE